MTHKTLSRTLSTVFAIAALALLASPALAQAGQGPHGGHGMRGPGGPGHGMHGLMRALELSDTQREQVHAIVERYHDEVLEPQHDAMREARQALAQAIHSTTGGEAAVREAAQVLAGLEADMAVQRHTMWLEIDSLLTDEQRQQAQEILAEGPPRRPMRRGGRGRR